MNTADRINQLSEKIDDILNYKSRRPLINLNKEVVLTLYIVVDVVFKILLTIKFL